MAAKTKFSEIPEDKKKEIVDQIGKQFGAGKEQLGQIRSDIDSGTFLPKVFRGGMMYDQGNSPQPTAQQPATQPVQRVSGRPNVSSPVMTKSNTPPPTGNIGGNPVVNYGDRGLPTAQTGNPLMTSSYLDRLQTGIEQAAQKDPYLFMSPEEIAKVQQFSNFMRNRGGA